MLRSDLSQRGRAKGAYTMRFTFTFSHLAFCLSMEPLTEDDPMVKLAGHCGATSLVEMMLKGEPVTLINFFGRALGDFRTSTLATYLTNNTVLTHVWLNDNDIGGPGMLYLARALEGNQTIVELRLADNPRILDDSGELLYQALSKNRSLRYIDLLGTRIQKRRGHLQRLAQRNQLAYEAIKPARRASLYLIAVCQQSDWEGMGDLKIIPKNVVILIARAVYATRWDTCWAPGYIEEAGNASRDAEAKKCLLQ